jgi:hypothetical protein
VSGEDFLSGTSGEVSGIRARATALLEDAFADTVAIGRLQGPRLRRAAARAPSRKVLALAIEQVGMPNLLAHARRELERSRHEVELIAAPAADRGKFENLNELLRAHPAQGHDWLLVVDDDVALPRGFLDVFLFLAERFDLRLAQPAHRRRSHAAWEVTRRRAGSSVRETAFVEIGPVVAFHAATFASLLPFPPLRVGWGLDLHWAAIARERGWRIGVVDATPIRHGQRPIAAAYDRSSAVAEAREFLTGRPYVRASDAGRTLATHRNWS